MGGSRTRGGGRGPGPSGSLRNRAGLCFPSRPAVAESRCLLDRLSRRLLLLLLGGECPSRGAEPAGGAGRGAWEAAPPGLRRGRGRGEGAGKARTPPLPSAAGGRLPSGLLLEGRFCQLPSPPLLSRGCGLVFLEQAFGAARARGTEGPRARRGLRKKSSMSHLFDAGATKCAVGRLPPLRESPHLTLLLVASPA